jgi:antitoxin HicB
MSPSAGARIAPREGEEEGEAAMKNKHIGSSVRSFFEERGEWDEVQALAQKKIIAEVFRRKMEKDKITKAELAKRMATSRSQLDAILNAEDAGLTLTSIMRICAALALRPDFRFTETRKAG